MHQFRAISLGKINLILTFRTQKSHCVITNYGVQLDSFSSEAVDNFHSHWHTPKQATFACEVSAAWGTHALTVARSLTARITNSRKRICFCDKLPRRCPFHQRLFYSCSLGAGCLKHCYVHQIFVILRFIHIFHNEKYKGNEIFLNGFFSKFLFLQVVTKAKM